MSCLFFFTAECRSQGKGIAVIQTKVNVNIYHRIHHHAQILLSSPLWVCFENLLYPWIIESSGRFIQHTKTACCLICRKWKTGWMSLFALLFIHMYVMFNLDLDCKKRETFENGSWAFRRLAVSLPFHWHLLSNLCLMLSFQGRAFTPNWRWLDGYCSGLKVRDIIM